MEDNDHGSKLSYAALLEENAKLKKANQRLQNKQKLLTEFVAGVSHELRSPLDAIIGFAQILYGERIGPQSQASKEYLFDILSSSNHMMIVINDLLDLAKVETGNIKLEPEYINLSTILEDTRNIFRSAITNKKIQFTVVVDPSLNAIYLDPVKLRQIIYNFVSNALKFSDKGDQITVAAKAENAGYFRLSVTDTGIGISAENLAQLFKPFMQLKHISGKKQPGSGLGLSLTKAIVEAQGGEVGVESEPSKGSTFFAILPRHLEPKP